MARGTPDRRIGEVERGTPDAGVGDEDILTQDEGDSRYLRGGAHDTRSHAGVPGVAGDLQPGSGSSGWTQGRLPIGLADGTLGESPAVTRAADVGALTNNTGEAADDTVEAVPAVTNAGVADAADLSETQDALAAIARNLSDLTSRINEVRTALRNANLMQ